MAFTKTAKPTASYTKTAKPFVVDSFVFQDGNNFVFQDGNNFVFDFRPGGEWSKVAKPA